MCDAELRIQLQSHNRRVCDTASIKSCVCNETFGGPNCNVQIVPIVLCLKESADLDSEWTCKTGSWTGAKWTGAPVQIIAQALENQRNNGLSRCSFFSSINKYTLSNSKVVPVYDAGFDITSPEQREVLLNVSTETRWKADWEVRPSVLTRTAGTMSPKDFLCKLSCASLRQGGEIAIEIQHMDLVILGEIVVGSTTRIWPSRHTPQPVCVNAGAALASKAWQRVLCNSRW